MNGQLEQIGDRWRLRFDRTLAQPPETVWQAITEPEQLQAWFPQRVVGEIAVGSTLRFEFEQGGGGHFEGAVLAVDPPKAFEFKWGTDVIRLEIEPTHGGCELTLLDTIDELGKAARDAAGWHVCLDKLELSLGGSTPMWEDMERWREVHPTYVERLGPEASTIGPPTG